MGYVAYNRSLYRNGFRPISNPYAASQLQGYTPREQARLGGSASFGPWRLQGLSQARPFTDAGGYGLHGLGELGAIVPDQSLVTYQGTWTPTYFMGATDLVNAVIQALTEDGLSVRNVSSNAGIVDTTIVGMTIQPTPFQVTLQLQVANGKGFGDPNDIISIIRHEVYAASGSFPISDSIPTVTPPQVPGAAAPAPTPTGQPCIPGAPGCSTPVPLSSWLSNNVFWIGLAFVAAIALPKVLDL